MIPVPTMRLPLLLRILTLVVLAAPAACAPPRPDVGALAPAPQRVTNEVKRADLATLDWWRGRIERAAATQSANPVVPRGQVLEIAGAWLDITREQYLRDARSPLTDEGLRKVRRLVEGLEAGEFPADTLPTPLAAECELPMPSPRGPMPGLSRLALGAEPALLPAPVAPAPIGARRGSVDRMYWRTVHFALNRAVLSARSRAILDHVIHELGGRDDYAIVIEGYTDPRGPQSFNDALSRRRADSVYAYLVRHGARFARFEVRALASSRRAGTGRTMTDFARDRRVELRFFDADGRELVAPSAESSDLQLEERPTRVPPKRQGATGRAAGATTRPSSRASAPIRRSP